jgi:hypothetical protein
LLTTCASCCSADCFRNALLCAPVRNPFRGSIYLSAVHVTARLAMLPIIGKLLVSYVHCGLLLSVGSLWLPPCATRWCWLRVFLRVLQAQYAAKMRFENKRNVSFESLKRANSKMKRCGVKLSRHLVPAVSLNYFVVLASVASNLEIRGVGGRFLNMLDLTSRGLVFQAAHNPVRARP